MALPDFLTLAQQCAPQVAPATLAAIVRVESEFNPYAIGVVHGRLMRQPANEAEAIATARTLEASGRNYSVGLAQVNHANWTRYGLTPQNAFDPCRNLAVGASILQRCFAQAHAAQPDVQQALRAGLSCYASGNFATGYRTGYVQRVVAGVTARATPSVAAIEPAVTAIPVAPLSRAAAARELQERVTMPDDGAPDPKQDRKRDPPAGSAVVF
ncbi:lytic transglycosylase domain-containing protein [Paraburkholderia sp. BL10I2N1]|uniref:lytic transglycosylase domain-containing protein n=1 Tax=Paraburkholderia sp. BL10I2N1 TaxID=1938796 RepID=UPI00105D2E6A|nr:lytic transglycosylase domain-containing protein [Paraburkholderia sp. BL10I2N1]TDN67177.1 type IV secretion system protein VirB1 [Paraburkholderia sp. BL10I2N1]